MRSSLFMQGFRMMMMAQNDCMINMPARNSKTVCLCGQIAGVCHSDQWLFQQDSVIVTRGL